jgi:dUTP pyrophosphatase
MKKSYVYPKLRVQKAYPDAKIPVRAHFDDAGLDVFAYKFLMMYSFTKKADQYVINTANKQGEILLSSGDRILIDTGIKATVGYGYEIQVRSRSGLALKRGLIVSNGVGTIDTGYKNNIGVILTNTNNDPIKITLNEKIAQLVVKEVVMSEVEVVDELSDTERGENGFGSTGS